MLLQRQQSYIKGNFYCPDITVHETSDWRQTFCPFYSKPKKIPYLYIKLKYGPLLAIKETKTKFSHMNNLSNKNYEFIHLNVRGVG